VKKQHAFSSDRVSVNALQYEEVVQVMWEGDAVHVG